MSGISENNTLLSMIGITKIFPGVVALKDVDFEIKYGEVHALVGENGAGKSTLIKILSGLYRPDSGDILLEGKKVYFANTHQSQQNNIAVIYQEFNLIPDLTVAENIFIGGNSKYRFLPIFNRKNADIIKNIMKNLAIFKITQEIGPYEIENRCTLMVSWDIC